MPASKSVVLRKGETLAELDKAAAGKTVSQLQQIITDLQQTGVDLLQTAGQQTEMTDQQKDCLQSNWFNGVGSYWPNDPDVASKFANGLAKALERSIQNQNSKSPTALPLDSYWLVSGSRFKVESTLVPGKQVTMIIITPEPTTT
jgi:hypothetical protein